MWPGAPLALVLAAVRLALGAAARQGLATTPTGAQGALSLREEVCRYCYRQCPISCFAGTCSLQYGPGVRRYQATSHCFSCDSSASVGVDLTSELKLCSAQEAAAAVEYPKAFIKGDKNPALRGPALPGDATREAERATQMAQAAEKQLQAAAATAERAAMTAVHKYRSGGASPTDSNTSGPFAANASADRMQVLQAHQMATQIRAEQALRVSEEAHSAWKVALKAYDDELVTLRKEQLKAAQAEEVAEHNRLLAVQARKDYAAAAAEAAQAAREELLTGESYANKIVQQANAEELASNARAAQRRLAIAAAEAKTASALTARAQDYEALPPPGLLQQGRGPGPAQTPAPPAARPLRAAP